MIIIDDSYGTVIQGIEFHSLSAGYTYTDGKDVVTESMIQDYTRDGYVLVRWVHY